MSLDENVNPYITLTIYQIKGKNIYQIDEICLKHPNNTVKDLAISFKTKYSKHNSKIYIYGDATSKKQDTKIEKGSNFFTLFKKYINFFDVVLRVPKRNPSVSVRGNFINEVLGSNYAGINVLIDNNCFYSIDDLRFTKEASDGGKFKQKVKDVRSGIIYEKYGHTSDTFDYMICKAFDTEFIDFQNRYSDYSEENGVNNPLLDGFC